MKGYRNEKGIDGFDLFHGFTPLGCSSCTVKATKDGIDQNKKTITLVGYDACIGDYGLVTLGPPWAAVPWPSFLVAIQ